MHVFFVCPDLHFPYVSLKPAHWITFLLFFPDGNMGSVTQLVTNEQPLAVAPVVTKPEFPTQNGFKEAPVYSNLLPQTQEPLAKGANSSLREAVCNLDDLQLDPVVLHENHVLTDRRKSSECKLDNDLTLHEKQNSLLSASRLRLLQDTTMIESALDLDSLDDSSIGTNSQAGLMKVV